VVKLATPISQLLHGASDEIVALSDCLECRDHSAESTLPRQYLFHCEKEIARPWDEKDHVYIKNVVLAKPDLRLISFHMAACCSDPVIKNGMYVPGGTMYTRDELLKFAIENIRWLKGVLPPQVKIAIENNNFYPTGAYQHVTDANFISEVVDRAGIRFLFDMAHAEITAWNTKVSSEDYLAALPMRQVIQIHVSQHALNAEGMAFDAHTLPNGNFYERVRAFTETLNPEYLTVEYYKDKDGLIEILRRCQELKGHESKKQ
jgi:uncharacterized protein (UPF0276 family)